MNIWRRIACSVLILTLVSVSILVPSTSARAETTPAANPTVAPVAFQNVSYALKPGVKTLPMNLSYSLKPMDVPDLLVPSPNTGAPSTGTGPKLLPSTTSSESPVITDIVPPIESLRFPIGSQFMTLNQNIPTFRPQMGEIYLDEANKSAFKVVGSPTINASGKQVLPVVHPELKEIFEYYRIPEQTLSLTTGNISYMAPGVKLEAPPTTGQSSDPALRLLNYNEANGIHVLTFEDFTIFEYPEREDDEDKDKPTKPSEFDSLSGEETTYFDKMSGADLDEDEEMSIRVWIDKGKITLIQPKLTTSIDISVEEQHIAATFTTDFEVDVTVKGQLTFHKVIETCVYGYDVDLAFGKAFVGVFLVVDIAGKVEVSVRTITTGDCVAGFKADAYFFVPLPPPLPHGNFNAKTLDVGFTVSGQITVKAAAVPQVGIVICDYPVGVLQLWVGLRADAAIEAGGGTGEAGGPAGRA